MLQKLIKCAICMLLCSVFLTGQAVAFDASQADYTLNSDNSKAHIPLCYVTERVMDRFGEYGALKEAEDLFYDQSGNLFIADTGNNRVLKCNLNGEVLWSYTGEGDRALSSPRGVFADENGIIYVADTANNRIACLSEKEGYIKSFVKPDSELLSDDLTFDVTKVAAGQTGYIYALKGKQFISMDENNEFKGFIGINNVKFSLTNLLIRILASDEQKKRITKPEPEPYANFTLGSDGMMYAVALDKSGQIKKLNAVGTNLFPDGSYGENYIGETGDVLFPSFSDISVSSAGIVTVSEENSCRIYQYDAEGRLLCVFGGKGKKEGRFMLPSSITEDSEGRLYVLDKLANNIQVMKRTPFIQSVHQALECYYNGDYDKAGDFWKETLTFNQSYELAHKNIAKTQYKSKDYRAAMDSYEKVNEAAGYSEAYDIYRHKIFREHFTLVVTVTVFLAAALIALIVFLKKAADRAAVEMVHGKGGRHNHG